MPLPEWKKRLPGKQSIKERAAANLLNHDLVRPFGPVGTTTAAIGLAKLPMGDDPVKDQWGANALVEDKSNVSATRPKHDKARSDIVR